MNWEEGAQPAHGRGPGPHNGWRQDQRVHMLEPRATSEKIVTARGKRCWWVKKATMFEEESMWHDMGVEDLHWRFGLGAILQHLYVHTLFDIPHHQLFLRTWSPSQPIGNACHSFSEVARGSNVHTTNTYVFLPNHGHLS